MKAFTLSAVLLLSCLTASARSITGLVYSDSTNTVVADAVCSLYVGDEKIDRTNTREDGVFVFNIASNEALALEIDKAGFSATEILIKAGKENVDLGQIALSNASVLDELKVESTDIIHSKGRTIVFPSKADLNASSTTLSLLQKLPLPGLMADPINRSISVRCGSPYILINGIPSTMSDINSLNPEDIAKIEYSYITPPRYADKGTNGFLSITLKERQDGGQVYLWGQSAVTTAFVDANLQTSYHQGPSQFTLQYSPSWRNYQEVYDNIYQQYIGNDFKVDIEQHERDPFNYAYHNISAKYDFAPSDRTLFSARFAARPMSTKNRKVGSLHDSELGDYDMKNISSSKDFTPSLDLFLRHNFNEKNTMELQMVGTLSSSDYRRDNLYMLDNGDSQQYVNDVNNRRRSLISELAYIHIFDETMSLSASFQNTLSHNTNEYLLTGFKPLLTENNNYIYARLSKQISRVHLSASTGVKMFWTRNDDLRKHYIRNLSSFAATWYISQKWAVEGSFEYSPSIPSLSSVTDYMQQISPYLYSNGNPGLKVAENFSYMLAAMFQHRKFSVILLSGIYNSRNSTFSDISYMGDGKFLSQSINAKSLFFWDNSLQLRLSDVCGFGANLSLGFSHYRSEIGPWKYNRNSFKARLNMWWSKGPWTISYYRKFPGKNVYGYEVSKEENGDALQVQFRPDKHWTIGASWMYMFDKKGSKYPAWSYSPVNPSYTERYIKDNGNMIVLSATYKTDFGALFKRNTSRSLNNADDNNSLLKN